MSRRTPQPEDGALHEELQPFRRWDEQVIFCGPTHWHDLVRFTFLCLMLEHPAQTLPDLKRIGVAAAGTAESQREAQAMWEHIEQTLTDWALAEGALRTYQSVLPTLLRPLGKLPARVRKRIQETTDPERLRAYLESVLRLETLDELPL